MWHVAESGAAISVSDAGHGRTGNRANAGAINALDNSLEQRLFFSPAE